MEQNGWKRDVKRLVLVVAASCVMAMNIKSFVRAGGLFPGGFTGLTLLIQQAADKFFHFSVPYSAVNLLLNLAPIMISFRFIGKKFTLYSCVAIVLTSILTDILPGYPITSDILLICVFGGLINGFAVSLCLFAGATSGGTDFIAIFFSERKGKETWNYILAGNVLMLAAAGFLFSWEQALYSIIFQFASTQILNGLYSRYQKLTLHMNSAEGGSPVVSLGSELLASSIRAMISSMSSQPSPGFAIFYIDSPRFRIVYDLLL